MVYKDWNWIGSFLSVLKSRPDGTFILTVSRGQHRLPPGAGWTWSSLTFCVSGHGWRTQLNTTQI